MSDVADFAEVIGRLWRGEADEALRRLESFPATARMLGLRARATKTMSDALAARDAARLEGDAPALIADAALLGEVHLGRGDARSALHALAEGLKVSEIVGEAAPAHLLAVLAHAQRAHGSPRKAAVTAEKALDRSAPGSPAEVLALVALGRDAEAREVLRRGHVAETFFAFDLWSS